MQKNKYIFNYISNVLSNKFFAVFIAISLIIFSVLIATLDTNIGYWKSLVFGLTYNHFICLAFLPMTMMFNVLMLNMFENNSSLVIRFKSTKTYIIELIKNIFISNTIFYFCLIMSILTLMNLFNNNFSINFIKILGITDLQYMIYTVIKLYLLMLIFSMFFLVIYKRFNKIFSFIAGFIFIFSLYPISYELTKLKNIFDIKLYLGNYYFDKLVYSNFSLQLLNFIIIIIFYTVLLFVMYIFYYKKTKRIDI